MTPDERIWVFRPLPNAHMPTSGQKTLAQNFRDTYMRAKIPMKGEWEMEKIELIWTLEGWIARSSDPRVQRLFGTDTIPTAYTANATADRVLTAIRQLNPDATVIVVEPARS